MGCYDVYTHARAPFLVPHSPPSPCRNLPACVCVQVDARAIDNTIPPGVQLQQQINVDCISYFSDPPVLEVSLKIEVKAIAPQGTAFAVELLYAAIFGMRNVPEDQIQPFMLAEAPRLIFPFARRVLADAIRDGGFPPLLLDPIDFGSLYMQQAQQMQTTAGEPAGHA